LSSIGASLVVIVAEEVRVLVPYMRLLRIAVTARNVYESKVAHRNFELVVEIVTARDDGYLGVLSEHKYSLNFRKPRTDL
jgi:hypothetical protein